MAAIGSVQKRDRFHVLKQRIEDVTKSNRKFYEPFESLNAKLDEVKRHVLARLGWEGGKGWKKVVPFTEPRHPQRLCVLDTRGLEP